MLFGWQAKTSVSGLAGGFSETAEAAGMDAQDYSEKRVHAGLGRTFISRSRKRPERAVFAITGNPRSRLWYVLVTVVSTPLNLYAGLGTGALIRKRRIIAPRCSISPSYLRWRGWLLCSVLALVICVIAAVFRDRPTVGGW